MSKTWVRLGLSNPKSPSNVGAVLRAAGCFGADSVCYTGERYDRAAPFSTETQKNSRSIPINRVEDLLDGVEEGVALVCVELVEGATPLQEYQHPEQAYYLFGPEDGTLDQRLIDQADAVVFIPSSGSLNLGASVNVLLYDRTAKMPAADSNNAIIRASRDKNNRARIKTLS